MTGLASHSFLWRKASVLHGGSWKRGDGEKKKKSAFLNFMKMISQLRGAAAKQMVKREKGGVRRNQMQNKRGKNKCEREKETCNASERN